MLLRLGSAMAKPNYLEFNRTKCRTHFVIAEEEKIACGPVNLDMMDEVVVLN